MRHPLASCSCSLVLFSSLLFSSLLAAQQPGAAPTPAATAPATKGDEVRRALVDADGGRRLTIAAAADAILAGDQTARARFMTTLRAITKVAPTPPAAEAKVPTGSPTPASAPKGDAPKPEFSDEVKQWMTSAATGDAEAQQASLTKLAADKTNEAALMQLHDRGKAVLARVVTTFVRRKLESNAIYAGQYLALRDFDPEASALLLGWVKEPPREGANPEGFRVACLRALRDTLSAEQATDALRTTLKEVAQKGQSSRNEALFLGAVCALHQFGDPTLFDRIKENVLKQLETGDEQAKAGARNTLAELHYQLRQYDEAATHYKALVAELEKRPEPPPNIATSIYNTACTLSLGGKIDEAFEYLEKALEAGKKTQPLTKALLDDDHDINNLRQDARFPALYEKYFGKPKPAK